MGDYLRVVSEFVAKTTYADIDPKILGHAKKVVYDTIGVIAAGAQEEEVKRLTQLLIDGDSTSGSTLIGQALKTNPLQAAFINGTAGTWLELDEGNQYARGHAAVHVLPAALAVGEVIGASGKDFLTAVTLGYEIACRVGKSSKLKMTMHPHGTWGTIGAAVAVGKLMKVNWEGMQRLINIASSLTLATSRRTMLEGGTVRNTYAGAGAYMGVLSYKLLKCGFTGELDGLKSVFGNVVSDVFDEEAFVANLGREYEIVKNYFKMYPCCRYVHASLDAVQKIVGRCSGEELHPEKIESIEVETYSLAAQLSDQKPSNMLAAKFSIPFCLASAIVFGSIWVENFQSDNLNDPRVRRLAERVFVKENSEFTAMMPRYRPSRVTVKLKDGRELTETVFVNKGDPEDPYSDEDLEGKFISLVKGIYGVEKAQEILRRIKQLDELANIRYLACEL
ncbi:MAG: MmgE/PrpD family protein [Candidatus Bathyarchaeia archaeon]